MTRRMIFVSDLCFLLVFLAAHTLSQARGSNGTVKVTPDEQQRKMTEQERKREMEKSRKQRKLDLEQRRREQRKETLEHERQVKSARAQHKLEIEQMRKEGERLKEEAGGFIFAKYALEVTEDQWMLIKPKLEKVRQLRGQARSGVGLFLTSSSGGGSGSGKNATLPTWQWKNPWKDKAPDELTEAQKLAKQLIALVERKEVAPGTLRRTMDDLRKARQQELEIEKQLAEARAELRKGLTTRQEAALVLMRWL